MRSGSEILGFAVDALELEEAGDATVVPLCQGAHLSRADDAHEAGLLEDLQVVTDRSLRHVQRSGELRRARRALAEEPDDPAAREVTKSAELLRVLDDEDVVELVVGGTVDDRGTYGIDRPFARERGSGRGRAARPAGRSAQGSSHVSSAPAGAGSGIDAEPGTARPATPLTDLRRERERQLRERDEVAVDLERMGLFLCGSTRPLPVPANVSHARW